MGDKNTLYYGDNLDILRRYIDDESVDLIGPASRSIGVDPPFNSNADYNVLFAEKDGTQAHAQIKAFEDTWTWDLPSRPGIRRSPPIRPSRRAGTKALKGLYDFLGTLVVRQDMIQLAMRRVACR